MPLSRRQFLQASAVAGAALVAAPGRAPAFVRSRPVITHGVQSGEVATRSGVVWTRADRPSRMLVQVLDGRHGRRPQWIEGPVLTGRHRLHRQGAGARACRRAGDVDYRVALQDLRNPAVRASRRRARSARRRRDERDVSFVWGGDIAGQGWGINPDLGGYRIFRAMAACEPDFFLCSGDTSTPTARSTETVALPDGRMWRNIVTPEKAKVAETLAEFRGNFAYNLLDENLARSPPRVPQLNQWDDHEVRNNWYPGEILDDPRYTERRVDVLAPRARSRRSSSGCRSPRAAGGSTARCRYGPLLDVFVLDMRTYKDPNDDNVYADPRRGLLGARAARVAQARARRARRATWKVIANDMPLGPRRARRPDRPEGVAQGDPGAPLGRELEFAEVLRFAHRRGVQRHRVAHRRRALHRRAPLRPGARRGRRLRPVLGVRLRPAQRRRVRAQRPRRDVRARGRVRVEPPPAPNTSPADGYQFFGQVEIDGQSRVMTVALRDIDGRERFSVHLAP